MPGLIAKILEHYGADMSHVRETGWQPVRCPFTESHAHDDSTKSASVSLPLDGFKCHACGTKGNAVTLIRDREGLSYADAVSRAEEISGESLGGLRRTASDEKPRRVSRWRDSLFA